MAPKKATGLLGRGNGLSIDTTTNAGTPSGSDDNGSGKKNDAGDDKAGAQGLLPLAEVRGQDRRLEAAPALHRDD
jgi:hypothetical protein